MENTEIGKDLNQDSVAVTLQMIGAVLEEIGTAALWKRGGRIVGISSDMETGVPPCVKVTILFDADKLKKHLAQKDAEEKQKLLDAIKQGYGLDESV
jgi:hypothetical protein